MFLNELREAITLILLMEVCTVFIHIYFFWYDINWSYLKKNLDISNILLLITKMFENCILEEWKNNDFYHGQHFKIVQLKNSWDNRENFFVQCFRHSCLLHCQADQMLYSRGALHAFLVSLPNRCTAHAVYVFYSHANANYKTLNTSNLIINVNYVVCCDFNELKSESYTSLLCFKSHWKCNLFIFWFLSLFTFRFS